MSLNDEIGKLILIKKNEIENEKIKNLTDSENFRKRVSEMMPVLQEITESVREGLIRVEIKENWNNQTTAVIVTLGNLRLLGRCTNSENMSPTGRGALWYFFPCTSVDGEESWSFNEYKVGHKWIKTPDELFEHLIPKIAGEIAKYE